MITEVEISNEKKEIAEAEIRDKRKSVDYRTLEYPIEIIVDKYLAGIDEDENELFIPDYQREMAWDDDRQSKFIESIFLGLPIPYIFVADSVADTLESEDLARLEIIDGTQRIRTLSRFIRNQLQLSNLKELESLNGFKFNDLPLSRQRRFKRTTIRMIQLTDKANEKIRRDIFERLNTGSVELNEMEKRRGIRPGKFLDLIEELSKENLFRDLCSFTEAEINKRDPQEFVLRFFAFLNNYKNYSGKKVHEFLDNYLEQENKSKSSNTDVMRDEFNRMLKFIKEYLPDALHIYRKTKEQYEPTTRIKFESITVGTALALRENKDLTPSSVSFINSREFDQLTKSDASSSKNKVALRLEYVRDCLLGKLGN